jgi:hypothetical protein
MSLKRSGRGNRPGRIFFGGEQTTLGGGLLSESSGVAESEGYSESSLPHAIPVARCPRKSRS